MTSNFSTLAEFFASRSFSSSVQAQLKRLEVSIYSQKLPGVTQQHRCIIKQTQEWKCEMSKTKTIVFSPSNGCIYQCPPVSKVINKQIRGFTTHSTQSLEHSGSTGTWVTLVCCTHQLASTCSYMMDYTRWREKPLGWCTVKTEKGRVEQIERITQGRKKDFWKEKGVYIEKREWGRVTWKNFPVMLFLYIIIQKKPRE